MSSKTKTFTAITSITFVILSMTGNAHIQDMEIELNPPELQTIADTLGINSRSVKKQVTPYDRSNIGTSLNPMMPDRRNVSKYKVIDRGQLKIAYAFNAEDISDYETYDDLQMLEIGETSTKYYSAFIYEADSIATAEMIEANRVYNINFNLDEGGVAMAIRGKHQGWSRSLFSEFFRNLSSNQLSEYCRMPGELKNMTATILKPFPIRIGKLRMMYRK